MSYSCGTLSLPSLPFHMLTVYRSCPPCILWSFFKRVLQNGVNVDKSNAMGGILSEHREDEWESDIDTFCSADRFFPRDELEGKVAIIHGTPYVFKTRLGKGGFGNWTLADALVNLRFSWILRCCLLGRSTGRDARGDQIYQHQRRADQ